MTVFSDENAELDLKITRKIEAPEHTKHLQHKQKQKQEQKIDLDNNNQIPKDAYLAPF